MRGRSRTRIIRLLALRAGSGRNRNAPKPLIRIKVVYTVPAVGSLLRGNGRMPQTSRALGPSRALVGRESLTSRALPTPPHSFGSFCLRRRNFDRDQGRGRRVGAIMAFGAAGPEWPVRGRGDKPPTRPLAPSAGGSQASGLHPAACPTTELKQGIRGLDAFSSSRGSRCHTKKCCTCRSRV